MNHPDLDVLTADASDLSSAEEREQIGAHLDRCPECLDLYSRICAERSLIEGTAPPGTGLGRSAGISVAVLLAAVAAGLGANSLMSAPPSAEESMRLLASPSTRARAAADLLRLGPSAVAALEQGAKEDDASVSRVSQDLLQMIAVEAAVETTTLIDGVAASWKRIQEEGRAKNPWTDKKDFQNAYQEWKEAHSPKEAALESAERAVLAWFKAQDKDKGLEWRVRRLLSEAAKDRNDLKSAAEQLDLAIASYPRVNYAIPSKHSKFQHLVNERAMMIWDEKGKAAAIDYAADLFLKDPRFQYFFTAPWERRFEEAKDEEGRYEFIQRMRAAFGARPSTFPDSDERTDSRK